MNVQTRVFSIVELVEAILEQANMSPLELLLARRINKTFNDVILHSRPFRHALFFELDLVGTDQDLDPETVEVNPFLRKIFPSATKEFFDVAFDPERTKGHISIGREDLIMQGIMCKDNNNTRRRLAHLGDYHCFVHLPQLETDGAADSFTQAQWYEKALWRKMYATRPALPVHIAGRSPYAHIDYMTPGTTPGEVVSAATKGTVAFSTPETQ